MKDRFVPKKEDGVDNWAILDQVTGQTLAPEVVCHVLNTLCRLDDAQKQVRAATIELKGGE